MSYWFDKTLQQFQHRGIENLWSNMTPAYSLPQNWYAIVHLDNQTFKIFIDRFDVTSGMDRCNSVKLEGIFDDEWKNEKETAPVMAAPKRKKPQRIRNTAAQKRVKPKHKYPLLYKNSWNTDWGNYYSEQLQNAADDVLERAKKMKCLW